jgi:hypothetical protein
LRKQDGGNKPLMSSPDLIVAHAGQESRLASILDLRAA